MAKLEKSDPTQRRQRRRKAAQLTDLSTVGLVFPVAMVVGFLGGRLLGSLFGFAEAGGLAGGGFGLVAGFYNVYRTATLLQARSSQSLAASEQEESVQPRPEAARRPDAPPDEARSG